MFLEIEKHIWEKVPFYDLSLACCDKCHETIYGENISKGTGREIFKLVTFTS
jgi:hypothetical protein